MRQLETVLDGLFAEKASIPVEYILFNVITKYTGIVNDTKGEGNLIDVFKGFIIQGSSLDVVFEKIGQGFGLPFIDEEAFVVFSVGNKMDFIFKSVV